MRSSSFSKKYVLTGTAFTGKSTVIDLLAAQGYPIVPETARIIIEEEQKKGSDILPWKDLFQFQEKVIERQTLLESEVLGEHIFLDRGVLDSYAYSKAGELTLPKKFFEGAHLRYHTVFILELLPGYQPDEVRKETSEYREVVHHALKEAYEEFGYKPVAVPVFSPEQRVEFILKHIKS